jgi:outer membrane lipoprotein-sorting protein
MKRTAAIAALLLLVWPLALAHAASEQAKADEKKDKKAEKEGAEPAPNSWYAERITHGDTGVAVENYWSKGRKLHAEIVISGASLVTYVSGEFYSIVDVTNQRGVRIRRSPEALALDRAKPSQRPFGNEADELVSKGAEVVRSDDLGGRPCRVLRLTDELGKREVWVTDDKKKLPLRVDFFARENGVHTTTDYIDWISELPIPDAFFEPDPRIPLETIEYADYLKRVTEGPVGPAPVLFSPLLHGK